MKKDFKEGAKAATPIILGYIPVGIAYGMMAKATGLTFFKALSFSLFVYTGAGQLPTAQAMVQNALDTLENKERKIVYSTPKEFDTSLLKETWLIRSDVSLENYYPIQKKEANYYWIENQDMSIIKKVKELDKNSFIALWR